MTNQDDLIVRSAVAQVRAAMRSREQFTFTITNLTTTIDAVSRYVTINGGTLALLKPREVARLLRAMADAIEDETKEPRKKS